MTVSSRSDSPTVPATAATHDNKMTSSEGPISDGIVDSATSKADQHDDEPTTNDRLASPADQHVSRDSENVDYAGDNDSSSEDGDKVSSSDESPTSVADGIPDGDSNADLHALLAFSKKRLDTVKQPPDGDGESQRDSATQEEAETKEQQEEKTDTDDVAAAAAPAETAQDNVPEETENAATNASDDNEGSNAAASEAKTKAEDDEGTDPAAAAAKTDGMSSKEAAAKASQADDSQKELWALLSYSKQRLETGAHAGGQKKEKKKSSSRKKRSSSMGTAGSMKSPLTSPTASPARRPKKSDAAAAEGDMEELQLEGGGGGENEKKANADAGDDDDDGQHSRESVASEGSDGERMDSDEEEYSNEDAEELSSDEEDSEEEDSEDSHDDSRGGIPATPSFLRQLEETDKEGPDSTDAKIMSDAARSYADAILSVADEKGTGDLTEKQMLEAMSVAEAAAAAGEERFTTSIAQLRLHEAKVASKKMAMSMKAEVDKAAKSAKTVKDRQVARQNKLFSGKRPAGKWITGKVKEFQETCAKVDGPP